MDDEVSSGNKNVALYLKKNLCGQIYSQTMAQIGMNMT